MCVLAGLAIGDVAGNQLIGIVLTVVGVVVLDFCADASEGPIRAYLLDVADTEEQDMALNIHAFSAGTLRSLIAYMPSLEDTCSQWESLSKRVPLTGFHLFHSETQDRRLTLGRNL